MKIACTHPCIKATVTIGVAETITAVLNSPTSKMAVVVVTDLAKGEGLEVTTTDLRTTKEATIIAIVIITSSATTRNRPITAAHTKVVIPQRVVLPTTCLIITAVKDLRKEKVVRVVLANSETAKIAAVELNIQALIRAMIDAKILTIKFVHISEAISTVLVVQLTALMILSARGPVHLLNSSSQER